MSKNKIVKDVIGLGLLSAINDLNAGPHIIRGSLTVEPGHDYWWFLEFGTGPFHEPDGSYDELIGHLNPPPEVLSYVSEGGAYDIVAKDAPLLVYMTKDGARRRREATIHPGIKPMGFIRSAIFDAELYLEQDFVRLRAQVKNGRRLPKRADFVELINYTLQVLLGQLRMTTPVDTDVDPYHAAERPHTPPLSEAWGITEAK